jgi:glycosyltransferase involved in cell wall biosynthesis
MRHLSVTLITLNAQDTIARAIRSVSFADEIIVVDSGSTDETVSIAKNLGAKVHLHAFNGYGQQKNYAADLCTHEWILNLDADEEVTPELAGNIQNLISQKNAPDLAHICRKNYFCNTWIKHGGWYPDWNARLYRKNSARWTEPHVHETLQLTDGGKSVYLDGALNHFSFPSIESQVERNLRYAGLGARELLKKRGCRPGLCSLWLRPLGKFIECYILKLGFLDGVNGLIIAINAAHSLFLKYAIARSLRPVIK